MKSISASGVERLVECPASHVLPQRDVYTEKAESGTENHSLLARFYNKHPGAEDELDEACPGLIDELIEPTNNVTELVSETAYVVDVLEKTSRFLGVNIDRKYAELLGRPLGRYEVGVSLDLQGSESGLPWLRDFKFGISHAFWQLRIQAMALAYPAPSELREAALAVNTGFFFCEPRTSGEYQVFESAQEMTLLELDGYAEMVVAAIKRAVAAEAQVRDHGGILEVREGPWCHYCGAFPQCPAKWTLARSVVGFNPEMSSELTPEQCGELWVKLSEIMHDIIEPVQKTLKERMSVEGGFPLPNKKRLKLVEMPGRAGFDQVRALELMDEYAVPRNVVAGLFKRGAPYTTVRTVNEDAKKRGKK